MSFDVNNPPPGRGYKVSLDKDETVEERWPRLIKDGLLFIAALALAGVVIGICIAVVLNASAMPEDRRWAMAVVSAAIGAILGYLLKR